MNKKKLIAAVLALTMSCSSVPLMNITAPCSVITANAADYDEVTEGDFTFQVYSDHAELIKFEATTVKDVTVPDKASGQPVTVIGNSAFRSNSVLTTVTIPDSVKTIGVCAFNGCSNLTEAVIGNGVVRIDEYAFADCNNLVDVTLGENVAEIGDSAFSCCSSLTELTLPQSVNVLGSYAFNKCLSLVTVKLSDNITVLNSETFWGCKSLRNITLPNKLEKIANNAFRDCSSLKKIVIPDSVVEMGTSAFFYCTSLASAEIGKGLKSIPEYSFADCDKLAEVSIGENVIEIQDHAFSGCGALTEVKLPDKLEVLGSGVFKSCSSLTKVTMGDEIATLNTEVFYNCDALTEIRLSEKLKTISSYAFRGCTALEAVTIPAAVSVIGDSAFSSTGIKSFDLPASVKTLGTNSLYNCNSLTELIVRNPNMVFKGDLLMPKKVTIKSYADSLAQEYAEDKGHPFVLLDSSSDVTTTTTTTTTTTAKPTTTTTTAKPTTTTTTAKPTTTTTTAKPTTTTTTAKPTTTTTTAQSTTTTAKSTTTTAKPASTTTTAASASVSTNTTTMTTLFDHASTTTGPVLPYEDILKNADVNEDGKIDNIDSLKIMNNMLADKNEFTGGKGDVNGDEIADFRDAYGILEYYGRVVSGGGSYYDMTECFKRTTKTNRKASISQTAVSVGTDTPNSSIKLEFSADVPVNAVSGQILFNGKTAYDAGIYRLEIFSSNNKVKCSINVVNGKFCAYGSDNGTNKNGSIIFSFTPSQPGEYVITYDDLKFYGTDFAEFSGYKKNGFDPYLTVAVPATSTITTPPPHETTTTTTIASIEQLLKNADVDGSGVIDSVDASLVNSYFLTDSWEETLKIRDFELFEGIGDVNGDGKANTVDSMAILEYYAKFTAGNEEGAKELLTNLSKAPRIMEKSVTISQNAASGNENDEYCEFVLNMNSELPISAIEGTLLFNGKTPAEVGINMIDDDTKKYSMWGNVKNGRFQIYSSLRNSPAKDSIIFQVYGIKAGEYSISYGDLKFYGNDGTEYRGFIKKDFDPYLTVNAAPAAPVLTNEQLMKNADINCDGKITMHDVSAMNGYVCGEEWMILPGDGVTQYPEEGKGDVNGDGKVNVVDCIFLNDYYDKLEKGEDVSEYFIGLTKLPKTIDKKVTISQAAVSCSEDDDYCEFVLKYSSEVPVSAVEGTLLVNGRPVSEVGFLGAEYTKKDDAKYIYDVNGENGKIAVRSVSEEKNTVDTIIFRIHKPKAGEYIVSYDDLKFYGPDCAEFSGYEKKDFTPYMTVNAASSENKKSLGDVDGNGLIDAVDASKISVVYARLSTGGTATEEEKAVCDVNKDGLIDAVDASKVRAYYAHVSTGGKLTLEEFLKK